MNLNDVPFLLLDKLVQFLYNMDYEDVLPADTDDSLLKLHAKMFALADRFDIPDLLLVAASKYSVRCLTSWEPIEFLASIRDVYKGTPPSLSSLRRAAYTAIRKNLPAMLDDETVLKRYDQTVTENPDFAQDLLRSYVTDPIFMRCYTCSSHQRMEILQVRCKQCRRGQ